MYYIVDSNIWIDVAQRKISCEDITSITSKPIAIAPFNITELVRGIVKGGQKYFPQNRAMMECAARCRILELPKVFISGKLWNSSHGVSRLRPSHYKTLLDMVIASPTHSAFLTKADKPESVWKRIGALDSIHEGQLDKELRSLGTLAEQASIRAIPIHMAMTNRLTGLVPDPEAFDECFSAAVEFLRSSILQVRRGANALKNNRGLYVDHQLFFYLADDDAVIVTNEDFSDEIQKSPQKDRIMTFAQFRAA